MTLLLPSCRACNPPPVGDRMWNPSHLEQLLSKDKGIIITSNKEGGRKLLEMKDLFMAQIVGLVSRVFTYLQTHQGVHVEHVQLFVCQSYL